MLTTGALNFYLFIFKQSAERKFKWLSFSWTETVIGHKCALGLGSLYIYESNLWHVEKQHNKIGSN